MKLFILLSFIIGFSLLHLQARTQDGSQAGERISTFFHIRPSQRTGLPNDQYNSSMPDPVGFIFENWDTLGHVNWTSELVTSFIWEKGEYFVKLDLPVSIANNSREMWCTAVGRNLTAHGFDTVRFKYGGVKLSKILLQLTSDPEGADKYLIPVRVWSKYYEKPNWEKNLSKLERFFVAPQKPPNPACALVDETNFIVIYRLGDKIKKLVYNTKPENIENPQKVWVEF